MKKTHPTLRGFFILLALASAVLLGCGGGGADPAPAPGGAAPDTTRPTVTITSTAPVLQNKTNSIPIPVTVTFSEPVTGFDLLDVLAAGGVPGSLAGSGSVYTFDVTPGGPPTLITVDIALDSAIDGAGNGNDAAPQFSIDFDAAFNPLDLPPTISDITDKATNQDTPLEFVLFSADEGAGEDVQILSVTGMTSDNQALIPDANIVNNIFVDNGALAGATGELTITPAALQTGTATITITVSDGNSTVQDTFVVTVNAVIDPPVAFNVNAVTSQNVAVPVTLAANDPGGDPIVAWNIDIQPTNGTLSGTPPNLTYTPDLGYSGRDSFTFSVTDSTGENSNVAIATLIVDGTADFIVADPAAILAGNMVYPGDETVYNEILALGFVVNLVDDNDVLGGVYTAADADVVDLLIISSSSGSANIGDTFRNSTTPVMTWERFLYDAAAGGFGMTGTTDVDDGFVVGATTINIVNGAHPLAGGLPNGATIVFNTPGDLVWGEVSADGEIVAEVDIGGGVFKPVLFVYEAGDVMQSGIVAPAKRVAYFLPDFGLGDLNADAITILHGAISEALAR